MQSRPLLLLVVGLAAIVVIAFSLADRPTLDTEIGAGRRAAEGTDARDDIAKLETTRSGSGDERLVSAGATKLSALRLQCASTAAVLSGEFTCEVCGAVTATGPLGVESLLHHEHHVTPVQVEARAPGYIPLLIEATATPVEPVRVIELQPALDAQLLFWFDADESPEEGHVAWLRAPSGRAEGVARPLRLEARASLDSSRSVLGANIAVPDPIALRLSDHGRDVGPIGPGATAVIDGRSGENVILVYNERGSERPGVANLPLLGRVHSEVPRLIPMATDATGVADYPPQERALMELTLDEAEPYSFTINQACDGVYYRGPTSVLVQTDIQMVEISVRKKGWTVRLVEEASGEPIDRPARVEYTMQDAGQPANSLGVALVRPDRNGRFTTPRAFPVIPGLVIGMTVSVEGHETWSGDLAAAVDSLMAAGTWSGTLEVRMRRSSAGYRLVVAEDTPSLNGRRVELVDEARVIVELRLESTSNGTYRSGVFSVPPGPYECRIGDDVTLGLEIPIPRDAETVVDVPVDLGPGAFRVVECRDVGDLVEWLYIANEAGSTWRLESGSERGTFSTRVLAGRYLLGPLDWVECEKHRLENRTFGLQVDASMEPLVSVIADPRWSSGSPVSTAIRVPTIDDHDLFVCPIYEPGSAAFLPERSAGLRRLEAGPIFLRPRDPVPLGYVVVARIECSSSPYMAPIAFVSPGSTRDLELEWVTVEATPEAAHVPGDRIDLAAQAGRFPECLAWTISRNTFTYPAIESLRIGPLDPYYLRLKIGPARAGIEVYPMNDDRSTLSTSVGGAR